MADFDLTQTDAQVQSILNDGQNMQGAGAQTTLTTESVLLKDVNGNYHKILKSSFTEAIRDTLAGLLVNNDKGTTINQIAAIANSDFGSITPANLASVLGGELKLREFTSSGNTGLHVGIGIIYNTSQGTYSYYGGVFTFVRGKENVTFIDITPNITFDTILTKNKWSELYFNAETGDVKVLILGV